MNKTNFNELSELIARRETEAEIESFYRSVILEAVQGSDSQHEQAKVLSAILEQIRIPIVDLPSCRDASPVGQSSGILSRPEAFSALGAAVCALIGYPICKIWDLPFLGCMLGIAGGVLSALILKRRTDYAPRKTNIDPPANEQGIYRTAARIAETVDQLVRCFNKLLEQKTVPAVPAATAYPLEQVPFISALRWLHDDLRRSKSPEDKEDLAFILDRCGYALKEYTPENADMFEKSSANISETITTVKALVNKETGDCIITGIVVFPLAD